MSGASMRMDFDATLNTCRDSEALWLRRLRRLLLQGACVIFCDCAMPPGAAAEQQTLGQCRRSGQMLHGNEQLVWGTHCYVNTQ